MTYMTEPSPDQEARQLRALLTMSRELMQVDKPSAALALAGKAMAELAHIDSALLLVRGEINECIAFDRTGTPGAATSGHDWYRAALARLDSGPDEPAMVDPRTMLVGVPARRTMAVLAAGYWRRGGADLGGAAQPAGHDSRIVHRDPGQDLGAHRARASGVGSVRTDGRHRRGACR